MSARANPTVIGAFVVGAIALLLIALVVWGGSGLFRTRLEYVLFFDAAVTGLTKGAPVLARGVKVGEVSDVQLRWGTTLVAVYIVIEPQALKGATPEGPAQRIEHAVREEGLRAQLRMQSFVTGVLYVALDVRPGTPMVLRGLERRVPELPTVPSDIEVWTAKLERFADAIGKVPLEQIGHTVAAVLEDVRQLVGAKETRDLVPGVNAVLADARTLVRRVDARVDPLLAQLAATAGRLDTTLDAAQKLVVDVDRRVDPLAIQAEATLKTARTAIDDARPVIEDLRRIAAKVEARADPLLISLHDTSDTARVTLERAQSTFASLDRTLEQESPLGVELFQMLRELRGAARSLRSLADYLERVPDAPVYGLRRPAGDVR